MKQIIKKTVLEVRSDHYAKVKELASKSNHTLKLFTSLLLEYALNKLDNGQIVIVDPSVDDVIEQGGRIHRRRSAGDSGQRESV